MDIIVLKNEHNILVTDISNLNEYSNVCQTISKKKGSNMYVLV